MLLKEDLSGSAEKIALESKFEFEVYKLRNLIERMENNYSSILEYANRLSDLSTTEPELVPGCAWILDNFYKVEELIVHLKSQLMKHHKLSLGILKENIFEGYPRIYPAALSFIDVTNGSFNEEIIIEYLKGYQNISVFSMSEIWFLNTILILAIVEKIKNVSEEIFLHQKIHTEMKGLDFSNKEATLSRIKNDLHNKPNISPMYIEHLINLIRKSNENCDYVFDYLGEKLLQYDTTVEKMISLAHMTSSSQNIFISNLFTSLGQLSQLSWNKIFEELSVVEKILRDDPAKIYDKMTFKSRNYYRSIIEKIARKHHLIETKIAHEALSLAKLNSAHDRKGHVGYYLVKNGKEDLLKSLGIEKKSPFKIRLTDKIYILEIVIFTIIANSLISLYIFNRSRSIPVTLLFSLLLLIPTSEIIIRILHGLLKKMFPLSILPKLELKEGIPDDMKTFVVVPTLIHSVDQIKTMCDKLEQYYISNKSDNLYFALLGEFKDHDTENDEDDQMIVTTALNSIKGLNKKYSKTLPIFFYVQRKRIYNAKQKKWICWERKRGSLTEFNNLISGNKDTSHKVVSSNIEYLIGKIKYIITLDEDTHLPIDAAKKLVGTIAHPLNNAYYDETLGRVTDGYAVIQPNVCIEFECSNISRFTKIYARSSGMSIYIEGFADVYQDTFQDGIFMGKGIYNLELFSKILNQAIPNNRVLSHDLLEGSYIRAAYASDINLIDTHPSHYIPYLLRAHRWIRGDWQLISWLKSEVHNSEGIKTKNPLSSLSKWKIFDNLRRSLNTTSLLLLIIFAIIINCNCNWFFFAFIIFSLFIPLGIEFLSVQTFKKTYTPNKNYKRRRKIKFSLKGSFQYILLQITFLPYESYMSLNAIFKSLYRVMISKMYLLEWTSASSQESYSHQSLRYFLSKMKSVFIFVLLFMTVTVALNSSLIVFILPLSIAWFLSPFIAYRISKKEITKLVIHPNILGELRKDARKIWSFYEDLANRSNHYLPPDNIQTYPPKGVAQRTSPTNIGLALLSIVSARDLGFITITRMIKMTSNMLDTIVTLRKWNGHLYNWYDTTDLKVLRPSYVSSVDSGNFVGYLIVLKQCLIEYKDLPVIDDDIVQGIRDYCEITGILNEDLDRTISDFGVITGKTAKQWFEFLNHLVKSAKSNKDCPPKMLTTIQELYREYQKYFSLIEYPEDEEDFKREEFVDIKSKIDDIKMETSLKDLRQYYNQILVSLKRTKKAKTESADIQAINKLENKIKSILCNLDDLLRAFKRMINIIDRVIAQTKFDLLYDPDKQLFSIGYDCENDQMTNSYYDFIASESRITSFISIINKQIPIEHWYRLNRSFVASKNTRALASWSGTMFEYFMPSLILKNYESSIFDETYLSVINLQKQYAESKNLPWGVSESAYYFFDLDLNYQYKAFGIPDLGVKRGLINDYVVSPYSTYLALQFDNQSAIDNLSILREEDAEGDYGFYESIDYTKERIGSNENKKVVKTYMAHHLGMSLLSINNFVNNQVMQKRFHSEPSVKTGEFLLQEKLPYRLSIIKELKEKERQIIEYQPKRIDLTRVFSAQEKIMPFCHILSNKHYKVMMTNTGMGFSKYDDKMITRFRADLNDRYYGFTFYFKDLDSHHIWTIGQEPIIDHSVQYEARFSLNKAEIVREDNKIATHLEVFVSAEDNVEIRRISIFNKKNKPVVIQTTSYAEIALNSQQADLTHPAFHNLFISTSFDEEMESLIAVRKPREMKDAESYLFQTIVLEGNDYGYTQYETDRSKFIGRGRSLKNPIALEKVLDNSEGVVIDPILSLRKSIRIEPNQKAVLTYIMGISESEEVAKSLIKKYKKTYVIHDQLELSMIKTQVVMNYLNLLKAEISLFQDMIAQLIYHNPNNSRYKDIIALNSKGQDGLWKFGISGDNPILLAILESPDDESHIWLLLKAKEFMRFKGLSVDFVVLNKHEYSYRNKIKEDIIEMTSKKFGYVSNTEDMGVFIIDHATITNEEIALLYASSKIIIDCSIGEISDQILVSDIKAPISKKRQFKSYDLTNETIPEKERKLKYFNGYGGFDTEKSEYVIRLNHNLTTPAPWINVISNDQFGTFISESGGSCTWAENSNENKLTPWTNDVLFDMPREILYAKDEEYGKLWSLTPQPLGKNINYEISHGKGYSKFESENINISHRLNIFVPLNDSLKVSTLLIKNHSSETRHLSYFYYVEPVMGVTSEISRHFIQSKFIENRYFQLINPYNYQFPNRLMYLFSTEKISSYTGNREEFNHSNLLNMNQFTNQTGVCYLPCGAIQINVLLKPSESKEIAFFLGQENSPDKVIQKIDYYSKIENIKYEFNQISNYWKSKLSKLQVKTPDHKFDVMMNSWLLYQSISCRMKARTAFYQTGGAFGYRDQLQDALNIAIIDPQKTKEQILLHASHQFKEGDVLHWWHPGDVEKGIRTRYSDDLLWLPFAVSEYLIVTEDYNILNQKISYVEGDALKEGQKDLYFAPKVSEIKESLYDHCINAIEYALKFGKHGLPLMGGGDWNDGMNQVGIKGKGESVWLAWFLYLILIRFSTISKSQNDSNRHLKYLDLSKELLANIESEGWDGSWYKRAYYDDGYPLGSIVNGECMIASLPQSWSVISGGAQARRAITAMNSVNNHLIVDERGIILLFTPPFEKTKRNPGYIKSYAKGLRENGGQYSHAATWVIMAFAILGEGTKAFELFQMLNPINHSRSIFSANHYKVEPYVLAADIYNVAPHIGRGGWTWYTGSAAWLYRVGMVNILGFELKGEKLWINPSIPNTWEKFSIDYKYKTSQYRIKVYNPDSISKGDQEITFDEEILSDNFIPLMDDGKIHHVKVKMIKSQ